MNTAVSSDPRIQEVRVTKDEIIAHLVDGRVISVPLAWSWRLSEATPAQRANFRLIGTGQGVHWPEIHEDITVRSIIKATVHPQSAQSGGESEEGRRPTPLGRARGEGRAVACPNASGRAFLAN